MDNKGYKISLAGFEASLHLFIESFVGRVMAMGYSEDEIVAVDPEEDCVLFYMSDGEIIRIEHTPLAISTKIAQA